jgi:hypothetical protein
VFIDDSNSAMRSNLCDVDHLQPIPKTDPCDANLVNGRASSVSPAF